MTKVRKFLFAGLFTILFLDAYSVVNAQKPLQRGDAQAGSQKSATCVACHSSDGNSLSGQWPKLAGQNEKYLWQQLRAFKDGSRPNPVMAGMVQSLSPQDMADLSAFYAEQTMSGGKADPDLAEHGAIIYHGGVPDDDIPACMGCHGPAGGGNGPAAFPRLAGQHAQYVEMRLKIYREGAMVSNNAEIMDDIAYRMSDGQIKAVASYIEGLHRVSNN